VPLLTAVAIFLFVSGVMGENVRFPRTKGSPSNVIEPLIELDFSEPHPITQTKARIKSVFEIDLSIMVTAPHFHH
jgi:hypothetical protein